MSQGTALTLGNRPPIIYHENNIATSTTVLVVNYIHGKQSIKIGAGVIRCQDAVTQIIDTTNGNWSGTSISPHCSPATT